ncbi:type III-B CRISPR module-associated Cmr3 family protein [Symbiobacterium thermophilum]|uniref:Type III-B CRISPR module-associated protein Cmr3 n=1 Tax=Symbiobacterium thermophilum TaxID=2734 RepID=A0A953IFB5_SYMTR|nr:type III-B CRISPR module-associated Cmr3 family protein [Symbiobacterium thermophilum]MBY6277450.1 hypothetical protein [Symbiobacterium thermophilum]
MRLWRFEALDTLFFRDGRPFEVGDNFVAASDYPPSGFTLQGAVRTAILQHLGVDLTRFALAVRQGADDPFIARLVDVFLRADAGGIALTGPFPMVGDDLLLPAPLDLYRAGGQWGLLRPGEPVPCDLGCVALPSADAPGLKVQEGKWVTAGQMERLLAGRTDVLGEALWSTVAEEDADGDHALVYRESRVGIARSVASRTTRESMLTTTTHTRPRCNSAIGVIVSGVPEEWVPQGPVAQQLGGEGRLARLSVGPAPALPQAPELRPVGGRVRFRLILATPARFGGGSWLPPGFAPHTESGRTCWVGDLEGLPVAVHSACLGKQVQIGGWDLAHGRPRPLRAYLPAGSVYFCEAPAAYAADVVTKLHHRKIGEDTIHGFGHLLVGTW